MRTLKINNNKLVKIEPGSFDELASVGLIQAYENLSLRVVSFFSNEIDTGSHDGSELEEFGFISEWAKFLKQF